MAEPRPRRTRRILTIAGLVLVIVLLYAERDIITDTWELLTTVEPGYLVWLPLFQILSYFFIANYYRSFLKAFDTKVRFQRLYGMTFALTFVGQILPSGGLSGVTYIIYGLRNRVSTGIVTLMQLGRYILNYTSYLIVLLVALGLLLFAGNTEGFIYIAVTGMVALLVTGIIFLLWALSSRSRVDMLIGSLGRFIDWVSKKFRKGEPLFGKEKIQSTLTEFHEGYVAFREKTTHVGRLQFFMLSSAAFEILIVITSFTLVGADINPGYILLAFALANAAGVLSVVPGDVGVHEGVIIAVLALAGVPASVAVSGTLLYRVFNKLLFLPIGFYFYSTLLKPAQPVKG